MKIGSFLKRNWKKIVSLVVLGGFSLNVFVACKQKIEVSTADTEPKEQIETPIDPQPQDPTNPVVTPTDPQDPAPDDPTPDDPTPDNPVVNPDDPTTPDDPTPADPTTPDDPVVEPTDPTEPSDPVVNPDDPTTPDDPTPADPTTPDDPVVEPTDPTEPSDPVVEPTDPTNPEDPTPDDPIIDPQPSELDFSGLEEKLVSVLQQKIRGVTVNDLAYSLKDDTLYVIYDYSKNNGSVVAVCNCFIGEVVNIVSQDDINRIESKVNVNNFNAVFAIQKTNNNITVNGETYSKNGIEGDNIFARRCGVENASMTYISNLGSQTFADTNTGYGKIIGILNLTNENKVVLKKFVVEYYSGYSDEQCYENFLNDQTSYLNDEEFIDLGDFIGLENNNQNENN